jgi:thiamine biosynthesis protein ThiI
MQPVIVLHHHEIVLKGDNRRYFERTLLGNIRRAVSAAGATCTVGGGYGKFILVPGPEGITGALTGALGRVFGLANICPGVRVSQDMNEVCAAAEASLSGEEFRTIRVDTRRVDKRFPLTSMETNAAVGAHLCGKFGVRASMSRPDVTVSIEIADGAVYVYSRRIPGPGGLPAGVSGRLVGLLSAGFDSPVACWRMIRRGCTVTFVHFHSMPYTSEASVGQVRDIVRVLTGWQFRSKLYVVPFAAVQNEIVVATEQSLRVVLYRRMMLRIAAAVAGREKAEGLVTGEAVGQVASQTLRNIRVIDSAVDLPILRPLSGADKEETIAAARTIGTHDISCSPYDDCCSFLAPRRPQTWADPLAVAEEEAKLDIPALAASALAASTLERFALPDAAGHPAPVHA